MARWSAGHGLSKEAIAQLPPSEVIFRQGEIIGRDTPQGRTQQSQPQAHASLPADGTSAAGEVATVRSMSRRRRKYPISTTLTAS